MKKNKGVLALVLSVLMAAGSLQVPAYAGQVPESETEITDEASEPEIITETETGVAAETFAETETESVAAMETEYATEETELVYETEFQQQAEIDLSVPDRQGGRVDTSGATDADPDDLFGWYVDLMFGQTTEEAVLLEADNRQKPGSQLKGLEAKLYNVLKTKIEEVASGKQTSTKFKVTLSDLGLAKKQWTAKDLGVKSLLNKDKTYYADGVIEKLKAAYDRDLAMDIEKVIWCLWSDLPYDLYWCDMYEGVSWDYFQVKLKDDYSAFVLDGTMPFDFAVSVDYRAKKSNAYKVNTKKVDAAKAAYNRALDVVSNNKNASDFDKLLAYNNEICRLTDYDEDAAAGNKSYGPSWQLISVFDNDPKTKTMAEGYARAFKFLCDNTKFKGNIRCGLVSGLWYPEENTSYSHEWNVVGMDNNVNYLVDVANSDDEDYDLFHWVFLAGIGKNDSPNINTDSQSIHLPNNNVWSYKYDEATLKTFPASDLKLGKGHYACRNGHSYQKFITEEATYQKPGKELMICKWCGDIKAGSRKDIPVVEVKSYKLAKSSLSVGWTKSLKMEEVIEPKISAPSGASWTSQNPDIVSVDENGVITGMNLGTTVVTATLNDFTSSCTVTVGFSDVLDPNRYFYNPVYWAVDHKITVGFGGGGRFSPDAPCQREQIVTFLWRLMGEPEPETYAEFTDVFENDWYYKSISWAAENGITVGLNDGTGRFGVGEPCTREMCVTFLYRAAGKPVVEGTNDFTDMAEGAYYINPVTWAAQNCITVGLNDGTGRFGIGGTCTRGMIVSFLYRYANLNK